MTAVFKHELRSYFHSLTAYVFGAFLLAFIGIGAMRYNLQAAVSNFEYVLSFASLVFVVIVPVLTMRVLAEERRQKTDQLLYSLPITTVQIIAGKYLALLVLYLIPLAIIAVYPLIFAQFGDVYLLTSYGSILAFFLLGAALIAVGVFLSSLTDNQGLAAGLGIAVILLNYYSVSLSEYVSSTPVGALAALLVLILAAGAVVRYQITGAEYEALMAASYDALRHQEVLPAALEDISQVDVTLEGETCTLTAADGADGPAFAYQGETLENTDFQSALQALTAVSFTDEAPTGKEEITLTLHLEGEGSPSVQIALYRFDGENCLATLDGKPLCLVDRSAAVALIEAVHAIVLN